MGRKRKETTGRYFNEETEQAVRDYLQTEDYNLRNRIFSKYLYQPLRKICEIYANTSQLEYVGEEKEDLINECLAHLIEYGFRNFKPDGKTRAYSYFSVSAKYWFIQKNMRGYVKHKRGWIPIDDKFDAEDDYHNKVEYDKNFLAKYYSFIEWYLPLIPTFKYTKTMEKHIRDVVSVMEEFDEVIHFFKKEVNDILKERAGDMSSTQARFARVHVYHQWLHFSKSWEDGEKNPQPAPKLMTATRDLNFNALTKKRKLYNSTSNKYYLKKGKFTE